MYRTDYEVRTSAGAAMFTSSDRQIALRFAKDNRETFPGLRVVEVIRSEQERSIWTDRQYLRAVAA